MKRVLTFLAVLALSALPLGAQAMTGILPWSAYKSFGFDTVNLASLTTHSDLPIYARPGRRLSFSLHLVYDSLVWGNSGYGWYADAGGGWQVATPIGQVVSYTVAGGSCGYLWYIDDSGHYGEWGGDDGSGTIYVTYWQFTDATGTLHTFPAAQWTTVDLGSPEGYDYDNDCPDSSSSGFSTTTADGTGYTLAVNDGGFGVVYNADGLQFSGNSVTDRNGNSMYFTVNGNTTSYFDTLSPSSLPALTVTASPNAYQPTAIVYNYTGAAGAESVTEKLAGTYYHTAFGCSGVQEASATPYQPYELDLPNGTKYQFTYDPHTGDLASAALPSGGTVTYARSFTCASGWTGGSATLSRIDNVDNGSWSWQQSAYNGGTETVQTDPSGGASASFYQGGFPVSAELISGAGGITEEVNTCYNGATTSCLSSAPALPITDRVTTTIMMEASQAKQIHQTFDALGKPVEVDETDWFSSSQSGPYIRKNITTYQAVGSVGEVPTEILTTDGGGNRAAETDYAYDQSSPQPTSGVLNHSAPPLGVRDNLTSITRWLNLGTSPVTSFTYDDTGQPLTSTDPDGHATSFSYADNFVGAPGGIVTNAFATTVTKPETSSPNPASHVTHASFIYATGAAASSTDENGQVTSYSYADPLSRLTEVDYPDQGSTRLAYNDTSYPQTVETRRLLSGNWSSGTSSDSFVATDGLGRAVIAASANDEATPYDRVDSCYDRAGRLLLVSYPYQASSPTGSPNCSAAGDTRSYDGMGRLIKITHSDASAINYAYYGRATEVRDEGNGNAQPMTRISQTDGLGRLASVCEVSGAAQQGRDGAPAACGLDIAANGFLTTYSHDLLNDLTQVNQGRVTARAFTFDSLGRMVEDNSPESPEVGYSLDGDGNVTIRTRAQPNQTDPSQRATTDYFYDALGRLTEINYPDGSTPTAYFNYDESSSRGVALAHTVGRRSSETTSDGLTASIFSYDAMGRILNNSQCTPVNCGAGMFHVGYSYDLAGDPTTTANPAGVTVTTSFNRAGRATAVASSLADPNHPATLIAGLHYNAAGEELTMVGNTDSGFQPFSEARCYSPRGALQDLAVQASASVPSCSATSGMAYWLQLGLEPNQAPASAADSANGNWNYSYDDFNRIATAAGSSSYSFAYDRQGNRWQQNLTAGGGPAPSFSFSGDANQMDGYSFDAAGNLLGDGRCSYSYDEESRALTAGTCASETFVYNAEGRRVRTANGSAIVDQVFDLDGHVLAEYSPGPEWARGEIFVNGRQFATYANSTTYLTLASQLNTARVRYDVHGNQAEVCQDLVFGDGLAGAGCGAGDPSPLHFTGQYRDYASGLDHMGARDYASALGRWLTPDPASAAAADPNNPQTWNRYAYSQDQPTVLSDPSGLLAVAQPCDDSGDCSWNDTNCTVDGMDSICNGLNGVGTNAVVECPNDDCGAVYYDPSQDGGQFYTLGGADAGGNLQWQWLGESYNQWTQDAANAAAMAYAKQQNLPPGTAFTITLNEQGGAVDDTIQAAPPFDVGLAAQGWSDPVSGWFHDGNPSWYSGDLFFNSVHTIYNGNANPEIHVDPWGPLNQPAHFLYQVVGGWLGGGHPLGTLHCVAGAGCS